MGLIFLKPFKTFIVQDLYDPYWNNVVLAMHMDGADNGTVFTDEKGKTATRFGNVVTKTGVKKYGTASAYFDGSGDYLNFTASTNWLFTGDFTIEAWINLSSLAGSPKTIFGMNNGSAWFDFRWYQSAFQATLNSGAGTWLGGTITTNTWTHVALVRYNGVVSCYVNGIKTATSVNNNSTLGFSDRVGCVGSDSSANNPFYGYMDDLRITKGIARYTANFTPPTKAFPNSGV